MLTAPDSVLVLFPGALGDFICFLPALWGLRERHTGPMRIIAKPELLGLIQLPATTTASIDRREIADLFAGGESISLATEALCGGFGSIYSWTGFGSTDFARRVALLGTRRVSVHCFRGMQPGEHAADYYARCVGLTPQRPPSSTFVQATEWIAVFRKHHELGDRPLVVMHAGSGSPRKNWQGFGAVLSHWRDRYGDALLLLQGAAEIERGTPLAAGGIPLAGLSLAQVAGLLHESSLYVGNDSGVSHLAGALGARGVVLFGPTDPARWAPRDGALQVLYAPEPCQRCGPDVFCVHRLSADSVIRTLEELRSVDSR